MFDAFPLRPIPEQMRAAVADVLGQLALCEAPLSGRRIACILAGDNEGYGGHIVERSATDVQDPFTMALDRLPSENTKLYGILAAGTGPMKEKHVLPSAKVYDKLAPHLLPGSPIIVVPPNTKNVCRYIPEAMHQAAYKPKPASTFLGKTLLQSTVEALRYTTLSPEDCKFVAHLRQAGLRDEILFNRQRQRPQWPQLCFATWQV